MTSCLFCTNNGPFNTVEHIIPESSGNDDLTLTGQVCDSCQAYFGKEVEHFVLAKSPLAFWRTYLRIPTKKGRLPSVDLSNPAQPKGSFPTTHPHHDNLIGFTAHEDGSCSVDIGDPRIARDIHEGQRHSFTFVITPKHLHMLARFLLKMGIELLAHKDTSVAHSSQYDDARRYARFGTGDQLWPLFHFSHGDIKNLINNERDEDGVLEHVRYYEFALLVVHEYMLLLFSMGTDHWVISLSHRYPDLRIQSAFPNYKLSLIWYPDFR